MRPLAHWPTALALGIALLAAGSVAFATDTVSKDLTHLDQSDPRGFDATTTNAGVNCTPTAMIQCLEWWARHGYAGLVPNANLNQIYAAVQTIGHQGRINKRGFGWRQVKEALEEWLQKHGNPRLQVAGHDDDVSYKAVSDQFKPTTANPNGQDVIWLGTQITQNSQGQDEEGAGHTMTLESMDTKTEVAVPGETGKGHKVSFADPATGARHDFVMGPSGALYEGSPLKKVYKPAGFYTVCPY